MTEDKMNDCRMMENSGNLYRLAEEIGVQERKIIDFSTPVNPLGVSQKVKAELRKRLKYLQSYPDPESRRLRKSVARYHGIDPETILCGNGSTELLYLIAETLKPSKIFISTPASLKYEMACRVCCNPAVEYSGPAEGDNFEMDTDNFIAAMARCFPHSEAQGSGPAGRGTIYLSNPNYPAGWLLTEGDVRRIANASRELGCYLVVDESFMDFCADNSVIGDVNDNPYLIVLRSMSPFHALSGLRVGYGVFHRDLISFIAGRKMPWTVNSLAQRAAVTALKDMAFRRKTLGTVQEEKRFLEKNFRKLGVNFLPSATNFYLLRMSNGREINLVLKSRGILLTGYSRFRGLDSTYMGIAVKSHRENAIFLKELRKALDRSVGLQCRSNSG